MTTASMINAFKLDFLIGLDGGTTSTVAAPSCPDQAAAPDGYQVNSNGGPSVYWRLGEDNSGQRILRIVNYCTYPVELQHPGLLVAESPGINFAQFAPLSHLIRSWRSSPTSVSAADPCRLPS